MISIPCPSAAIRVFPCCSTDAPVFFHRPPSLIWRSWTWRSSPWRTSVRATDSSGAGASAAYPSSQQMRTLFPGGFKRPEIKVPTLILKLSSGDVLDSEDCLAIVDSAVSNLVGVVVLECREESGGRLYEAARALKSVIRGRAYFLISERVDIAAAVGSSEVMLSDQGLPTIVARNMMMESNSSSILLPLVARTVESASSALGASNAEGADFLILAFKENKDVEIAANSVFQSVKVPVFMMFDSVEGGQSLTVASNLLQSGASGLLVSLDAMKSLTGDALSKLLSYASLKNEKSQNDIQIDMESDFIGINRWQIILLLKKGLKSS